MGVDPLQHVDEVRVRIHVVEHARGEEALDLPGFLTRWIRSHGWVYTGTNGETRDTDKATTSRTTAPALDPTSGPLTCGGYS